MTHQSLARLIATYCDCAGPPLHGHLHQTGGFPQCYVNVLMTANGFTTRRQFFRVFGLKSICGLPSVADHNLNVWGTDYGSCIARFLIVAEDVFGDQYGYSPDSGSTPYLVKLFCEGGRIQRLPFDSFESFLRHTVLTDGPDAFDFKLAEYAYAAGLQPSAMDHLAFELPLICGGEYQLQNLGVESRSLHLGVLGQIVRQNYGLQDGTKITRFVGGDN